MGQAPKHESRDKITELEAEKGDAKMTLVPCIMALSTVTASLPGTSTVGDP